MRARILSITAILTMLTAAGCGGRRAAVPVAGSRAGCVLLPGPEAPAETIRIALPDRIDPLHAPLPDNDSERTLFTQLYETLITIDCEGDIRPGLSSRWHRGIDGARWTFELRDDARFWDGSAVTAEDIVDCWQSREIEPSVWAAGVDSVAEAGDRAVHVYLSRPDDDVPRQLSAPPFAVARRRPWNPWPEGTSPLRMEIRPARPGRALTIVPARGGYGPVLVFTETGLTGNSDPRDLLEDQADLILTRDPDVIEYSAARPHLEIVPLPWSRTYVLLSTTRAVEVRLGDRLPVMGRAFRDDLARDAVPVIARGHGSDRWRKGSEECFSFPADQTLRRSGASELRLPGAGRPCRILFDEDDQTARSLAERIVALGASGARGAAGVAGLAEAVPGIADQEGGVSAEGVPEEELERSLDEGEEFAYVIWLPLNPPDPCSGVRELMDRARWLSGFGAALGDVVLPLVDTRDYAIIRKGTAGLATDWNGSLYIARTPAGAQSPAERR